jgi:hypothetical protein
MTTKRGEELKDTKVKDIGDIIDQNDVRIKFIDREDKRTMFTVERNVGQSLFDENPGSFLALDSHDGEGGWFMMRGDVVALHAWLGRVLERTQ